MMEENKIEPEVSIIIINWNNYEDTSECLSSLEQIDYTNYNVFVVDNGSKDQSGDILSKEFSWANFIFLEQNVGFAAGNNVAIQKAMEDDPDYILLLNNDTVVFEDFLNKLTQTAEDLDKTIVGGIGLSPCNEEPEPIGKLFLPSIATIIKDSDPEMGSCYEVDCLWGYLMLIPSSFIRKFGGLNEDYFFGFDDVEYCYRARENGWDIVLEPESKIIHKGSSTGGKMNPFRAYHNTRNRFQFVFDNLGYLKILVFIFSFLPLEFIRMTKALNNDNLNLLEIPNIMLYSLLGSFDYLMNREHRPPSSF
ncbi:MAG: glycosyltransferase family 2 protein [Candidatus Paceibacteria bacterium]